MSKSLLDRVQIQTPCQTDWGAMQGDDRVRHCVQCDKHVYNLSQMTRQQAEALLAKTNGKLCARFERCPDGSILTNDPSFSLPRFKARFLCFAAATMSAALSLSPSVTAKTPKNLPVLQQQDKKEKSAQQAQEEEKTAKIFGTVFDEHKAVIAKATVKLINFATKKESRAETSAEGTYEFSLLEAGLFHLIIQSPGFSQFKQEGIILQIGQAQQIDAVLKVGLVGEVVIIEPTPKQPMKQISHILQKLKAASEQ